MPSTAISDIAYDDDSEVLQVTFVSNGRRYAYLGVPATVYDDFLQARSKGAFFNQHIRDAYDCKLLYDPNAPES